MNLKENTLQKLGYTLYDNDGIRIGTSIYTEKNYFLYINRLGATRSISYARLGHAEPPTEWFLGMYYAELYKQWYVDLLVSDKTAVAKIGSKGGFYDPSHHHCFTLKEPLTKFTNVLPILSNKLGVDFFSTDGEAYSMHKNSPAYFYRLVPKGKPKNKNLHLITFSEVEEVL